MRLVIAALIATAACGRVGFDALGDARDGSPGDGGDGGDGGVQNVFTELEMPEGGSLSSIVASPGTQPVYYTNGYFGRAYRSTDTTTWQACAFVPTFTMAADATTVFAAATRDIYKSTDQCASWTATGLRQQASSLVAVPGVLYATTTIGLYAYDGTTWTQQATPADAAGQFTAVTASPTGSIVLAGTLTQLVRHTSAWVDVSDQLDTGNVATLAWVGGTTHAYLAEDSSGASVGDILRSDDGGATWTPVYDVGAGPIAADPTDSNHIVIGSFDDLIKSEDDFDSSPDTGLRYQIYPFDVAGLAFEPDGKLLAATDGGVWETDDSRDDFFWNPQSSGIDSWLIYQIAGSGSDLYLGTQSGVMHSQNGGPFTLSVDGIDVDTYATAVLPVGNYVFTSGRQVRRSADHGATWDLVYDAQNGDAYGVYTLATDGSRIYAGTGTRLLLADPGANGMYDNWTTTQIGTGDVNVNRVTYAGSTLWIATSSGLYKSVTRGTMSTPVAALGSNNCEAVAVDAAGDVLVGTANGLWIGTSAGATWTQAFTGSAVFDVVSKGTTIVIATHAGIQISRDGGATWADLPGIDDRVTSALHIDAAGDLLAGTYSAGLWRAPLP